MRAIRRAVPLASSLAVAFGLIAGGAEAQQETSPSAGAPQILFTSHDPIEFTLEADFDQLGKDRAEDTPERPAALILAGPGGEPVRLDVQVRTRGKFRLQRATCALPNLRLNLQKKQLEGTVLEGQDKLKMVGYCRDRDGYEQNVLEEYLVYRAYNLFTDASFRVRLARITYRDASGKGNPITRYGFLIEDEDALAERLGGRMVDVAAVAPQSLDGKASTLMALFQYMVGNTDWSETQFHNMEVVQLPDGTGAPIAYDFDFSGVVDAPYAAPNPVLGTRSVRERVYRGFCRPEVEMSSLYPVFQEKRPAIEELFRTQQGLEDGNATRAIRYLNEFFETIGSPRRASNSIERACRRPGMP